MRVRFPRRTVESIIVAYKNHTYKDKKEFIIPLCVNNRQEIHPGIKKKIGNSWKIEDELSTKDVCKSDHRWCGEMHSHVRERDVEMFSEFKRGNSDDDINHIISKKFDDHYEFPALFCVVQPVKNTDEELDLDIQCEHWKDFDVGDLVGIDRDPTIIVPSPVDVKYPFHKPFTKKHIEQWKKGDETGKSGYPALMSVDINEYQRKFYEEGPESIPEEEHAKAYLANYYYQADMASLKKGLKDRGILSEDSHLVSCHWKEIGRKKRRIMSCDTKEFDLVF